MAEKDQKVAVEQARGAARVISKGEVDKLIRGSVYGAMGAGIVPLHWFQFASVAAVQLNLIRQLSNVYGVEFKEGIAKKIIASVVSSGVSTVAAPLLRVAVSGIPLVGLPLAVGMQPMTNGFATYAVGRMFVTHFERGGNFVKVNMDEMKKDFSEAYQHSREWVGNVVGGKKDGQEEALEVPETPAVTES